MEQKEREMEEAILKVKLKENLWFFNWKERVILFTASV